MKKSIAIGVLVSILSVLSCTNETISIQEPDVKDSTEKSENSSLRATEGRALLAELFAASLNEETVAQELSEMVSLERDGDREVLLEEILPDESLRSSSSLYSSLESSFNNSKHLRSTNSNTSLSNFKTFESFAEHLISIDPLVQVAVVSKYEEDPAINLKKDDVLVVYLPEDYDDQKEMWLTAYDKTGKAHLIKSSEEPNVPVIVIGDNERVIPVAKGDAVVKDKNLGKLYLEGKYQDYYLRPDIINIIDGPIYHPVYPKPTPKQPKYDRERHPDYDEYLESANFENQSAMRKYESFWRGRPEMKYTVIPVKAPGMKFSGECTNKGWGKGAIKKLNIRLFNWNREDFGNYYLVHWTEVDGGPISEVTPKIQGEVFGIKIEASFKIDLGSKDDEVGGAIVSYKDKALSGQKYDIGEMFHFSIKIA